jgi:hypothetical protein
VARRSISVLEHTETVCKDVHAQVTALQVPAAIRRPLGSAIISTSLIDMYLSLSLSLSLPPSLSLFLSLSLEIIVQQ